MEGHERGYRWPQEVKGVVGGAYRGRGYAVCWDSECWLSVHNKGKAARTRWLLLTTFPRHVDTINGCCASAHSKSADLRFLIPKQLEALHVVLVASRRPWSQWYYISEWVECLVWGYQLGSMRLEYVIVSSYYCVAVHIWSYLNTRSRLIEFEIDILSLPQFKCMRVDIL